MGEGFRPLVALALAALLTGLTVPIAISLATRLGFLDVPSGFKAHLRPTPYLGGAAVLAAALPTTALLDPGIASRYWPLLGGALAMAALGACDDRLNLSPWLRLALEAVAGWVLWSEGLGWSFLHQDLANLLLTVFWVTGLVNAFNLMDNLDGAAASVAASSAAGVAALAAIGGEVPLAALSAALCGALLGFLRFNLAEPARIFLGDGGSMPVGFLVAGALMSAPMGDLSGSAAFAAAALVVALPAFDTTLVVVSRRRRGIRILTGGTDHTTHRLLAALRSPRAVAATLAGAQVSLCGLAVETTRLGESAVLAIATFALLLAAAIIVVAEGPGWAPASGDS